MSERTLQALRGRINARLQTSAISRDRASAAGREVVAQCRQSDVETLEWVLSEIDALLRTPRGEGDGRADRMQAMLAVSQSLSRVVAAMQAAWIEWRHGRGADAAMQWIENTLIGPGLIPGDDESDAQAFFDRAIAEIENHQIRHAAALRSEAQGEGWQVTEPARDIVRREMPETRATVREANRAARRGEGGGE